MPRVLFDTSIYIKILRRGDTARDRRASAAGASLWLSAVVLEELYAGASGRDLQTVERLERDFDSAGRIAIPTLADWSSAGKILASLAKKYGYERIGRARLSNDALIAASAARLGIAVITANSRDFAKLAEFRPFQWRLQAAPS